MLKEIPVVDLIVGLQWGDEGKGAVADRLSANPKYKIVIRPAGGNNAGHTVFIGNKRFALHHIPAGILHGKIAILGSGMCINPLALMEEINDLEKAGIPTASLYISDRASLLMPWHIEEDLLQEKARGKDKIGTTCKGIGPCYRDHIDRVGLRLSDFADSEERWRVKLKSKLGEVLERLERLYPSFVPAEFFARFPFENLEAIRRLLASKVVDLPEFLRERRHQGGGILIEGAQGAMLDIRHGTYPFVTSSHPTAIGCLDGMGIGPGDVTDVIGVLKAYVTRVGEGPFPTRMDRTTEALIRALGKEQGTTTGRDRNCGWLDFVQLRYAAKLNSVTGIIVTKFDFFHELSTLRVCHSYQRNGEEIKYLPADMVGCEANFTDVEVWVEPVKNSTQVMDLPAACRNYLWKISNTLEVPIVGLSLGPERSDAIELSPTETVIY
ncbi:MAG: adenylosuccinate synthetase PurA [Parcubacteria group bacterium Gr01-1014_20]|nr:MAG: adenylosuccinate synthetase PurA [Parcubacteria group bacterium Gr01-1014_20]